MIAKNPAPAPVWRPAAKALPSPYGRRPALGQTPLATIPVIDDPWFAVVIDGVALASALALGSHQRLLWNREIKRAAEARERPQEKAAGTFWFVVSGMALIKLLHDLSRPAGM